VSRHLLKPTRTEVLTASSGYSELKYEYVMFIIRTLPSDAFKVQPQTSE
jgi:hypothetical protein